MVLPKQTCIASPGLQVSRAITESIRINEQGHSQLYYLKYLIISTVFNSITFNKALFYVALANLYNIETFKK